MPPWVYTVHGLAFRQTGGWAHRAVRFASEALSCQSAGHVICVAAADLQAVRSFVSGQRCSHIPNAIAPSAVQPKALARSKLGLGPDDTVVGCVARLTPGKGLHVLVEAMASVRPGAVLAIVGEGEERQRLLSFQQRGVRLMLCGERDDVPEVLSAFDVFALPSFWEGEPLALLEALHAGLRCVAADNSGSREVLSGSSNGVLVPPGDAGALAQAISQTLNMPPVTEPVASLVPSRSPQVIAANYLPCTVTCFLPTKDLPNAVDSHRRCRIYR